MNTTTTTATGRRSTPFVVKGDTLAHCREASEISPFLDAFAWRTAGLTR